MKYILLLLIGFSCNAKVIDDVIDGEMQTVDKVLKDEIGQNPSTPEYHRGRPRVNICVGRGSDG